MSGKIEEKSGLDKIKRLKQGRRKIESRMQKLEMQKQMNFMDNLGQHVLAINNRPCVSLFNMGDIPLKQDESDSQLNRCRLQLQEIERQQLYKNRQERIKQQVNQKRHQFQCKKEIVDVEEGCQNNKEESLLCGLQTYVPQQCNNLQWASTDTSLPQTAQPTQQIKQLLMIRPAIQELNEQQVHVITDNLELIFDIFKDKVPLQDQIQIIRLLYVKYIGPEEGIDQKQRKINACEKRIQDKGKIINGRRDNAIEKGSGSSSQVSSSFPFSQNTMRMNELMKLENKPQHLIQKHSTPIIMSPIEQKRHQQKRAKQSNQRYFDQQNVAKLFIKHGYGLHVARKYLGQTIVSNQYTNLITTIIRQTWRRIEDYISRIQKINPMNTNDFKVIKTSLVNCVKWMDSTDIQTFYEFVKVAYNLSNVQPCEQEAIRLYNSCIQRYKELRGGFDAQMRVKMEKKFAYQIKGDAVLASPRQKQALKVGLSKGNKAQSRGPSEHQLGDLIGLIKSQLKQTTKAPNHMNPHQIPPVINTSLIIKPQPPNMNLPRQANNFVQNGQRR